MIHIINRKNKGCLIYIPDKQALFTSNPLTANVLNAYYNNGESIDDICAQYLLKREEIANIVKMIESLPCHTNISAENNRHDIEIMVNLAHDCNLRCDYCYAQAGTYGLKRELMHEDIGRKCIEFFNLNYKNTNLHFLFFGGEPMLNFRTLKEICEISENINPDNNNIFRFRIISNGTILTDEIIDYMKRFKIGFTVSIDGPQFIHDHLRKYPNGTGSYKKIIVNLTRLKKRYPDCPIIYEATYTSVHEKYGYTPADLKMFFEIELGLKNGSIIPVFQTKYVSSNLKPTYFSNTPTEFLEKGDFIGNPLFYPLSYFVAKRKPRYVCYTGISHFTVTPNGDIYPCQLFIGTENLLMGNVTNKHWGSKYNEVLNNLSGFDKEKNPVCMKCWAKYLCKDCPGNIYQETGNLIMPTDRCDKKKYSIEALLLKLAEIKEDANKWQNFIELVESCKKKILEVEVYG
ncbi:MAG: radical SAM protein [candidate division WOR-3 bacterium]